MSTTPEQIADRSATTVTVYWRPGCAFCGRLLRWLDRSGVPTTRHNIWDDPEAATAVRGVTGGDETVPTVTIGDHTMVNPSPRALQAAIEAHAPDLLPETTTSAPRWWERVTGSS